MSGLDLVRLARTAATRAGSYLSSVQRPAGPADWTLKGARDFVTEVDRTAERIIVEVLLKGEPGSRVVGEELAPELVTDGLVWIVDPLDGTTNFLHGFPSYAVSIGASVDGKLLAGVVLDVPRRHDILGGRWSRRVAGRSASPRIHNRQSGVCLDRDRLSIS